MMLLMEKDVVQEQLDNLRHAQTLIDQANASLAELQEVQGLESYLSRISMQLEDIVENLGKVARN